MNLSCDLSLATRYHSRSQIARVLTENWCARELYCPACPCDSLSLARANTEAIDFHCSSCQQPFQLKSGKSWSEGKIVDAGYGAMLRAVRSDRTPNLLVLQYSSDWSIEKLMLIPRFFFSETAIQKRKPLAETARRAGWIGCNIMLSQIPTDGKIRMVWNGSPVPKNHVREKFDEVRGLCSITPQRRGWTLDVLATIRQLNKAAFSLRDVYAFEEELERKHPSNRNVKPKIRQQLQVLRDLGLIKFLAPGRYEIVN